MAIIWMSCRPIVYLNLNPRLETNTTVSGGARARQVKWPGWKIHRPGSSPGFALPIPAYCFASVIVWTGNKNVTISDSFICFILTVKRRWLPVFWGRQLKKGHQLFLRKKVHPGDLAGGFSDLEMTWLLYSRHCTKSANSDIHTTQKWHHIQSQ